MDYKINHINTNPKELSPSMKKYEKKFNLKANKIENNFSPSLSEMVEKNGYSVIEWENGWAQINLTKDSIIVHSMFSDNSTQFKYEYLYELANALDKTNIIFETERNPEAWVRLINSAAKKLNNNSKAEIKGYIIGITINKENNDVT